MGHVHTDKCEEIYLDCSKNHEHNDNCYKEKQICGQMTDYEKEVWGR